MTLKLDPKFFPLLTKTDKGYEATVLSKKKNNLLVDLKADNNVTITTTLDNSVENLDKTIVAGSTLYFDDEGALSHHQPPKVDLKQSAKNRASPALEVHYG